MVIYDLLCDASHGFEGWFKNAEDFQEQQAVGILLCPFCNSSSISKKLTAPKLNRKSNSAAAKQDVVVGGGSVMTPSTNATPANAQAYAQLQQMLGQVHEFVDNNFEDVGNRFADEALTIHRGGEPKNIKGSASAEDLTKLAEEGVTALPLPPRPIDKKKLN